MLPKVNYVYDWKEIKEEDYLEDFASD